MTKFGHDKESEEDLPGDELIIKSIKQEPNQVINKISIMKDGKLQEIEEEVPDIKITKKRIIDTTPQDKEKEKKPEEKKIEQRDISYPSYKDKDNLIKSDNKEESSSSMRNKYKHKVKTDEKEPSNLDKQPEIKEVKEFKTIEQPEKQKPKEKAKTYPYSKYLGRNKKPK